MKPRFEFLLPMDIKKIRTDLHDDPNEFARIEKYFNQVNKLKNRLISMKLERADI